MFSINQNQIMLTNADIKPTSNTLTLLTLNNDLLFYLLRFLPIQFFFNSMTLVNKKISLLPKQDNFWNSLYEKPFKIKQSWEDYLENRINYQSSLINAAIKTRAFNFLDQEVQNWSLNNIFFICLIPKKYQYKYNNALLELLFQSQISLRIQYLKQASETYKPIEEEVKSKITELQNYKFDYINLPPNELQSVSKCLNDNNIEKKFKKILSSLGKKLKTNLKNYKQLFSLNEYEYLKLLFKFVFWDSDSDEKNPNKPYDKLKTLLFDPITSYSIEHYCKKFGYDYKSECKNTSKSQTNGLWIAIEVRNLKFLQSYSIIFEKSFRQTHLSPMVNKLLTQPTYLLFQSIKIKLNDTALIQFLINCDKKTECPSEERDSYYNSAINEAIRLDLHHITILLLTKENSNLNTVESINHYINLYRDGNYSEFVSFVIYDNIIPLDKKISTRFRKLATHTHLYLSTALQSQSNVIIYTPTLKKNLEFLRLMLILGFDPSNLVNPNEIKTINYLFQCALQNKIIFNLDEIPLLYKNANTYIPILKNISFIDIFDRYEKSIRIINSISKLPSVVIFFIFDYLYLNEIFKFMPLFKKQHKDLSTNQNFWTYLYNKDFKTNRYKNYTDYNKQFILALALQNRATKFLSNKTAQWNLHSIISFNYTFNKNIVLAMMHKSQLQLRIPYLQKFREEINPLENQFLKNFLEIKQYKFDLQFSNDEDELQIYNKSLSAKNKIILADFSNDLNKILSQLKKSVNDSLNDTDIKSKFTPKKLLFLKNYFKILFFDENDKKNIDLKELSVQKFLFDPIPAFPINADEESFSPNGYVLHRFFDNFSHLFIPNKVNGLSLGVIIGNMHFLAACRDTINSLPLINGLLKKNLILELLKASVMSKNEAVVEFLLNSFAPLPEIPYLETVYQPILEESISHSLYYIAMRVIVEINLSNFPKLNSARLLNCTRQYRNDDLIFLILFSIIKIDLDINIDGSTLLEKVASDAQLHLKYPSQEESPRSRNLLEKLRLLMILGADPKKFTQDNNPKTNPKFAINYILSKSNPTIESAEKKVDSVLELSAQDRDNLKKISFMSYNNK